MIFAHRQKGKNMRLIDADALIERLKPYIEKYGETEFPYSMVHDAFVDEVKQEPTTFDAVPVRHGEWIDTGRWSNNFPHHAWRCSVCMEEVLMIDKPWFKFCPICGARMDKDENY